MRWEFILLACLCFLNSYAECKWKRENHERRDNNWRENANEVVTEPYHRQDPPDHKKLIPMARYVLHNAGTNYHNL